MTSDDEPIGYIEDDIVKYWKTLKQVSMERDIITDTENLLETLTLPLENNETFVTQKEKLTLESWLGVQLEIERKGWKKKLELSFKEIERERNLANIAHMTVIKTYEVISNLNTIDTSGIHGFNSVNTLRDSINYMAADQDSRVKAINSLSKKVEMMSSLLKFLIDERHCCIHLLNNFNKSYEQTNDETILTSESEIDEQSPDISLFDILLERLNNTVDENCTIQKDLQEKGINLKFELRRSQEELQSVTDLLLLERKERAEERAILTKFIAKQTIHDGMSLNITLAASRLHSNTKFTQTAKLSTKDFASQVETQIIEIKNSDDNSEEEIVQNTKIKVKRKLQKKFEKISEDYNQLCKENWQLELYRRQLAWIKYNPTTSLKCAYRSTLVAQQTQVNSINTMPIKLAKSNVLPPLNKLQNVKNEEHTVKSTKVYKCIRCNSKFTSINNCRYHPKSKKIIDITTTGVQIWECCLQSCDSKGCCIGYHIAA